MKLTYLSGLLACCLFGAAGVQAAPQDLGKFHSDSQQGCKTCHVSPNKIDDSEAHENQQCRSCHGDYNDLKNPALEIDPHGSHLGDIACTSCHKGHEAPKFYCNECHSFEHKPMPFADVKAKPAWDKEWDQQKIQQAIAAGPKQSTDVVVIGAGSAGYNAAISAKQAGAKVVLLEKAPFSGGNSMLAAGGYNAVGTKQQAAHKVDDQVAWYVEDTMKGGRYANDPKLVQILAQQSADGIKWLESLGANMDDLKRSGGARVDRTHRPSGGLSVGPHIIDVLRKAADKNQVETRLNSRAVKLVVNDEQQILGVVIHGKHSGYYMLGAKSVVLATGGYGMNKEMIAYHRPTFKGMTSSNNITATGDGIEMAKSIGASMTDIDWIQAHPTIGKDSRILISETVRGVGAIMVNKDGKRFINELTTRDRASDAILKQPEQFAWLVFDNQLYKKAKMVRGYDHLKMLKKADNVAELAKLTGMQPKALEQTVSSYNRSFKVGKDSEFNRENMPLDLTQAPFYAVKVAPGIHHTMGGVAIDEKAEVLNLQSWPIKGLYAAGEVTGGVHGYNRLGGNAVADTVIFGRIAGKNAADNALAK